MKQFFNIVFVTLGVIFLMCIFGGVYLFVADPFHIKPMLFGSPATFSPAKVPSPNPTTTGETTTNSSDSGGSSFILTDAQRAAIQALGIDPSKIPTTVSAAQESCFISVLGEARVGEIRAGAIPNALEFYRAKACI